MPHLDFVALREPVTCTLPTDEPGRKRLVRQFRRFELELYEQARTLQEAGEVEACLLIYNDLCRFAVEGITADELDALTPVDKVRLLGAALGKLELVEAALGNVRGGGEGLSQTEPQPPPVIQVSTPTTQEQQPLAG